MRRLHAPPLLSAGARVALVAPAGPLADGDLARATDNARSFGWEPVVGRHATARSGYFAGSDADRLADLNTAITDPSIDGIWCIRGGYGAMRLLDHVNYDALPPAPKALIGYSDITALHAAFSGRAGIMSFHGPTARATLTDFSRRSLRQAVVCGEESCGAAPGGHTLRPGVARGRLVAGNLSLISSLMGTPYQPDLDGAILVLEDVNEAVYRLDRMLVQLRLAGVLQRCAGLVFGAFTQANEITDDGAEGGARSLDEVLLEAAGSLDVPCFAGAPVGHIQDQWTLPVGAWVELDAGAHTLTLESTLTG